MKSNNILEFVLDNQIKKIHFNENNQFSPTTTLLQYLRSLPNHKGVKEGCAEGDCGACTVVIIETEKDNSLNYKAVDSCLILLPMVHGKQIITVENLGSSKQLHPVQKAMVEYDGSQCGFCTPGIVMSLFSYSKNETTYEKETVNDYLAGNLCRCTGYKSIINAAENIPLNSKNDFFDEKMIINQLKKIDTKTSLSFTNKKQQYYKTFNLPDTLNLIWNYPEATIINGSTDVALQITKQKKKIPLIIDISEVKELSRITKTDTELIIGSGVKLDKIKNEIGNRYEALSSMLSVFGSKQIRNLATMGGNIGSASPIGDILPVLIAYDAKIKLQNKNKERMVLAKEFVTGYRKTIIEPNEIITEIIIPKTNKNRHIKSYKISKRKELDISSVSGGFMVQLNEEHKVEELCLAYGGMAEITKKAEKTEKLLINNKWNRENIEKAMHALEDDFTPISDARSSAEARMIMAKNLLLKFWTETETL
ncbi:MAG: xanthine dehydrogenase small subunit [Chlorobi bacterium]|nr:xanthine dehydrogenase small subunit [Chlorobiota bacterium]